MSMTRNNSLMLIACIALALCGYESFGQSLNDGAARAQLAGEIRQKYGIRVSTDLSLPELYLIINGLNEILTIAREDHASLQAGDCRGSEIDEMEARIAMANRINQQFGTNLDWRQYDFLELFLLDEKLRGKSQTAEK
jgi:hypothetical protein